MPSTRLVAGLALAALALAAGPASAQPLQVDWGQREVELQVAPGTTASASATFRLTAFVDSLDVAVADPADGRAAGPRIVAGLETLGKVAAGVDVTVPITASAATIDTGEYIAELVLRAQRAVIGKLRLRLIVGKIGELAPCVKTVPPSPPRTPITFVWTKKSTQTETVAPFRAETIVPPAGCRITVTLGDEAALPSLDAIVGWRLLVESSDATALLRLEARDATSASFHASDAGRPGQELAIPGQFDGHVDVKRTDLNPGDIHVQVLLIQEQLDGLDRKGTRRGPPFLKSIALAGYASRIDLDMATYSGLTSLAQGYRDRERGEANKAATASKAGADKATAYKRVSAWLGRRLESMPGQYEPKSEPIVLFIGIAGLSRIVLLDCLGWPLSVAARTAGHECDRLSDPWQTTFERAENFWAAYVEDDHTSFDTSIDVEFDSDRRAPEYDGYDIQNAVRTNNESIAQTDVRRVRIGFRRFPIPRRARRSKVTFIRQGPSYGLRSWSREFVRYGLHRASLAGGLAIPVPLIERDTIALSDVFAGDAIHPSAVALTRTVQRQPLLTMGFIRFPAFRAAAEETGTLWKWVMPDGAFGVAFPVVDGGFRAQSYLLGGSWELVFGNRVHFLAGLLKSRTFETGYADGARFPLGTPLDAVGTIRSQWSKVFGISVDIARTP